MTIAPYNRTSLQKCKSIKGSLQEVCRARHRLDGHGNERSLSSTKIESKNCNYIASKTPLPGWSHPASMLVPAIGMQSKECSAFRIIRTLFIPKGIICHM